MGGTNGNFPRYGTVSIMQLCRAVIFHQNILTISFFVELYFRLAPSGWEPAEPDHWVQKKRSKKQPKTISSELPRHQVRVILLAEDLQCLFILL